MGVWSSQLSDELHKPVRERFRKRSVFAKQVDDIWTTDLVDMSPYSRPNSGYKYLLTLIDVFSKYGWIVPLKTKTGKEVAMAFQLHYLNFTLRKKGTLENTQLDRGGVYHYSCESY